MTGDSPEDPPSDARDPNRRYFLDENDRSCWVLRMGKFRGQTLYWIGRVGSEPHVFTSDRENESWFTEEELRQLLSET